MGCVSAIDSNGRTIWIVDAHRDGKRFVVTADEKLTAFLELERVMSESQSLKMASRTEELWCEVYGALEAHRFHSEGPDPDAQFALNRIVKDCLGFKKTHRIHNSTCDIREELLDVDLLKGLIKYHEGKEPQRDKEPIIVLEGANRRWLIDGHNRVNKWCANDVQQERRAIILTPRQAASEVV